MRIVTHHAATAIECAECFVEAAEGMQCQSAIDVSSAEIGRNRERTIKGDNRGVRAVALDQDSAVPSMAFGKIRFERKRPLDAGRGFVEPTRVMQHSAVQLPRCKPRRIGCDDLLAAGEGGCAVAFFVKDRGSLKQRFRPSRMHRKCPFDVCEGAVELLLVGE
jgi:hypothetical protein